MIEFDINKCYNCADILEWISAQTITELEKGTKLWGKFGKESPKEEALKRMSSGMRTC